MKTCPHRHLTTGPQNSSIHSSLKVDTAQLSIHECTLSHVRLSATLWTVARQALLSMGLCRQEHWRGLPCPPPGGPPDPETGPASLTSPALAGGFFATNVTWEARTNSLMGSVPQRLGCPPVCPPATNCYPSSMCGGPWL